MGMVLHVCLLACWHAMRHASYCALYQIKDSTNFIWQASYQLLYDFRCS